jgi:exopolysaccharide production protein ExoQ
MEPVMSSASAIVADSWPVGSKFVRAGFVATILTFCLPLVGTWWMLYAIEHNFAYASIDDETTNVDTDLADNAAGSSAIRQISLLALGAIGFMLLLMPSREPFVVNRWLLAMITAVGTLMILSALWADDSALSLKRSAQPPLLAIAAAGFVKHLRPRQFYLFVVAVTSGVLLFGFVATCANGTFLQTPAYRFGGTLHPNFQGVNCAALCLASLALLCEPRCRDGGFNWQWLIPLVIGLAFLYLTRSRTTSFALVAAFAAFFIVKAPLARTLVVILIAALLTPALGVLWLDAESNMSDLMFSVVQMGRDDDIQKATSLTGRIPIWRHVLSDISARPLLGHGCGAFWTPQRVWEYSFIHDWQFTHAHSAYLETLLNNGAIGLALGLIVVVSAARMAILGFQRTDDVGFRFVFAVLTMALIHGFVDSNFVVVGFASFLVLMCIFHIVLHGPQLERNFVPVE